MSNRRLEMLRSLVEQNPGDSRTRYMLAMEMANAGELEGAVEQYEALLQLDADFAYACFHCGQTLERLGKPEQARDMYTRGIEAAGRKGDSHASSELQAALDQLS